MAMSYVVFDTITGERLASLARPATMPWKTSLSTIGDGSTTLRMYDGQSRLSRAMLDRLQNAPASLTFAVCWERDDVVSTTGPRPLYAGAGQRITSWNERTGVLTFSHREHRMFLAGRYLWPAMTVAHTEKRTITGRSRRGIARDLVAASVASDGSTDAPRELPWVFESAEAGSESEEYFAYEWQTIEELLSDQQAATGGPDIYWEPRFSGEFGRPLYFGVMFGDPLIDRAEDPIVVTWGIEASPVDDLGYTLNGTGVRTAVVALGKGSEEDMRFGRAQITGPRTPAFETVVSEKTVDSVPKLSAIANSEAIATRRPTKQFALKLRAGKFLHRLRPGSRIILHVGKDAGRGVSPVVSGEYELYVLSVSGSTTDVVIVEVVLL